MILTSLRCFLNAIVPTTDQDTLLKSHYYVLDVMDNRMSDSVEYDDCGNIKVNHAKINNNFRVEYCPEIFNPQPHTSTIQYMNVPGGASLANRQSSYLKHLMNSDTKYKVYGKIFHEITDNPKMLIMFDEHNIIEYGPIIAIYMSQIFGVDIEFIDESLRPNVFGNKPGIYKGNVAQGQITIRECKIGKLQKDIKLMIDEYSKESTHTNLVSLFSCYSTEDLINIYNTIFTDKPLAYGTYMKDDMMNILIGTICSELEFKQSNHSYSSISTYENDLSDWEKLEEDFRYEMLHDAEMLQSAANNAGY